MRRRRYYDTSRTESYWLGYLRAALANAALELDAAGAHLEARQALRGVREYEASDTARPRVVNGWALLDAKGDCWAIVDTYQQVVEAERAAKAHLFGAATSGHPRANNWVAEHIPFHHLMIDELERRVLRDEGIPMLEREGE